MVDGAQAHTSCKSLVESRLKGCELVSKASSFFGRLSKRVWQSHSLRLSTKIQVYRAIVVPTFLYGAETWVLYRKQIRLLERFHRRCLRSILGIRWQDYVLNDEVFRRANLHLASGASALGWPRNRDGRRTHAQKQSSSASSKKESAIVVLKGSVTKIS